MQQLSLTPYQDTNLLAMGAQIEIELKDAMFRPVPFADGQTTFAIHNRSFDKVVINNIEEIDYENISIGFFGCFIKKIEIKNITSKNISLGFYGSVIGGVLKSENLRSVALNNSHIYSSLFVLQVEKVWISYSKENLHLPRWAQLIRLTGIVHRKEFITKKQSVYLNDVKQINFTSNFVYEGIISKTNLHLSITYNNEIADTMTGIDNAYLRSISLSGKSSGRISIDNTKVESIYIREFSPKEDVSFFNITSVTEKNEKSKIEIHKSDLSKVWFDNVDFGQFESISFYRSKFSKTIFMSCSFPNDYARFKTFSQYANIHDPDKKGPNPAKDNYEMFLQLKASLESTGNYYEGQKLQAMAHAALKEIKDIPRGDKIILCLNSLSNKHALSISRPFWWFMGTTIFFYIVYLISIGMFYLDLSTAPDWNLIGFYFSFIDLTHRNEFLVGKEKLTFIAQMIDYFNKLTMGYLIFQFISAFRKYSKK